MTVVREGKYVLDMMRHLNSGAGSGGMDCYDERWKPDAPIGITRLARYPVERNA